ncbi:MAG: amidohydrolase family protein [Alphaproteobacteria bacterium]|nr:amidohydrolase family protein [Alphaproteobacteria bacterium]
MTIDIIDTHQHLIEPDRLDYLWPSKVNALAGRAFTYGDYRDASAGTGIAQSIFMEADCEDWKAETDMVLDMVADPRTDMIGVIANARPEFDDGFDAWLDRVTGTDVVGLRRILHETTDDVSQCDVFRANLRKLAARDLTFDINFLVRQLPIAADLVHAVDNVQFILDHCGVPDIKGGDDAPWRAGIKTLAGFPNVACKISGITAYCAPGRATLETLRPFIEHCIDCFGWDRVVWGSDWPVCNINCSIRDWTAISKAVVASEDRANQEKLFRSNAIRVYGLRGLDSDG